MACDAFNRVARPNSIRLKRSARLKTRGHSVHNNWTSFCFPLQGQILGIGKLIFLSEVGDLNERLRQVVCSRTRAEVARPFEQVRFGFPNSSCSTVL